MIASSIWATAAEHLGTFLLGLGVGLALSSRYRIVRLGSTKTNGNSAPP